MSQEGVGYATRIDERIDAQLYKSHRGLYLPS
jgi:hypothetical protein